MNTELDANETIHRIYYGLPSRKTDERRQVFFTASQDAWSIGVVGVLTALEEEIVGPFALGDEVVSLRSRSFPASRLFRDASLFADLASSPTILASLSPIFTSSHGLLD